MTIQHLERSPLHESVHHGFILATSPVDPVRGALGMSPKQLAVTTRPMHDDDAMLLFELYASARTEELSRTGWATPQQRSFFRMQAQIQEKHYSRHYDHLDRRTICINGFSAGRLLVDRPASGYTVVDIGLLPTFRGRGVGTLLLHWILEESEAAQVPLTIELAKDSPALRLVERLGFGEHVDLGERWRLTWTSPAAASEPRLGLVP